MEEAVKRAEAEREAHVPKWWSEWLALNRPESENTKSGVEKIDENAAGPQKKSDKVD